MLCVCRHVIMRKEEVRKGVCVFNLNHPLTTDSSRVKLMAGNISDPHSPEGRPYHQRREPIPEVPVSKATVYTTAPREYFSCYYSNEWRNL